MKAQGVSLERMAAFAAVADAGSFTAAAARMELSKSALSQAVALLERELGVQLLQRSTRRLAITEAGAAFLADCRALLAPAEQVIERARGGRTQLSGTLRITSALDSIAPVAEWIAEYRARYPAMRVEYLPTDQRMDLIEGRFDLALRLGRMQDSSMRAARLTDLRLLLVASPAYLVRHGTPRTPRELAAHEWLVLSVMPSPWSAVFVSRGGKTQSVRMRGSVSSSAAAALKALALAGAGVAALPEPIVSTELNEGRLKQLLANYRLPQLYFCAVYPSTLTPPAKTRAFIDLAKERANAAKSDAVPDRRSPIE
jgi:DNA-binding transcriptional LysR family regulator